MKPLNLIESPEPIPDIGLDSGRQQRTRRFFPEILEEDPGEFDATDFRGWDIDWVDGPDPDLAPLLRRPSLA